MPVTRHDFTGTIIDILKSHFPEHSEELLDRSELLQYLNLKTKAANRGSKARAALANHYAIYVLVEDYLNQEFHNKGGYDEYEGAQFTPLLSRIRELPFGRKLQNHALNSRVTDEFKGFFPNSPYLPIIRDQKTNRYWINEKLLTVTLGHTVCNIAEAVKTIIDAYIEARQRAFKEFMVYCLAFRSSEVAD